MLNFLIRKIYFKGLDKESKYLAELTLESFKSTLLANTLLILFFTLPFATATTLFITNIKNLSLLNIIVVVIISLISFVFIFIFIVTFINEILQFRKSIIIKLYAQKLKRGNALTSDDFNILKEENEPLFNSITNFECSGFCYAVSFQLLKALKKGTFWFIAIKWNDTINANPYPYTMHALYEYDNWCYDPYSMQQHQFDFALDHFGAKKYLCFSYEDIKDMSYHEFREKTANELKVWCEANDCYEEWSDFSIT